MQSEQFQLHADIEQRHWWFVGRREIMRGLAREVLPPAPGATVIDVGCGTGGNIASLADDYRAIGIDTSAEAVQWARARFPKVHFLQGRAPGDLGPLLAQARLVLLMDVLEHVSDDFTLLSELLAAADPGTHFLLTVPADPALWSVHDESFGHYRRYDRARLEMVWAGLPVSTRLVSYFNARLLPVVRLVRWRNRRRGQAAGRVGTDFWLPSRPVNALLQAILAGEARRLLQTLHGRRRQGYSAGSSLIAILRREEGPIAVRQKPARLPPDRRVDL
jgi:SAM-dependent methyltransferase